MNNAKAMDQQTPSDSIEALAPTLNRMKTAFTQSPAPSFGVRVDRLNRLHNAILAYKDKLITAVNQDFQNRSTAETTLLELLPILEGIRHNKKHLRQWMKPSNRSAPLMLFGSKAQVHYQPLGVLGIVVPWNFPIFLGLSPLVGAFAAGNVAMIKTSEYAPLTGKVVQEMITEYFSTDEAVVFTGGVDMATAFTKLPFDHLVFTGSTTVGRIVMKAAAENLTPVTLELGGKSPAIIHDSFPIEEAAKRVAFGKGLNAGQVCVSPDYMLVPKGKVDAFIDHFAKAISTSYPTLRDNQDYTAIITPRQRERLLDNIKDAQEKGAEIITINPAGESFEGSQKLPMFVLKNVTNQTRVMQEEIFGPILPVVPYEDVEEAITFVNERPRPLSLYYFDWNKTRARQILKRTHSGGVAVNDVMTHVMVDDMPFGGVGPSGMGHYHGKEGFLNFSKAKSMVRKGKFNPTAMIAAPWGNRLYNAYMSFQFRRFKKIA